MEGIVLGLVVEVSRNEENDCSSSQTTETIGLLLASLLVLAEFGSSFLPSPPLFSIALPANECARFLPTDRILKTSSGKRTRVYSSIAIALWKWKSVRKNTSLLKTQNVGPRQSRSSAIQKPTKL